MPLHPLWMVLFLIVSAIVVVVVLAIVGAATRAAPAQGEPLNILARRFAAGEIGAEEYQKARDLLQGADPKSS